MGKIAKCVLRCIWVTMKTKLQSRIESLTNPMAICTPLLRLDLLTQRTTGCQSLGKAPGMFQVTRHARIVTQSTMAQLAPHARLVRPTSGESPDVAPECLAAQIANQQESRGS